MNHHSYQWKVPFTYITSLSTDPVKNLITDKTGMTIMYTQHTHTHTHVMLLYILCLCLLYSVLPDKSIQLERAVSWIKANPGQTGLYRVNYDMSDWIQFVSLLHHDHTVRY